LQEIRRKHGDDRRTEITGEEVGSIDLEDLITEENMVVSISHRGYIKRTPSSIYRAQRRGGKGVRGAQVEEEDPIAHLFVASTHAYLLFFTSKGRVYWQKVYDLPQLGRESKGRAIVNLLNLGEGETITHCQPVRDFDLPGHFLMMATRKGLVKKTALEAYSRPKRGGIIGIKLREDDELVDVVVTKPGDEVVLATANGMAIRFSEANVRPMGRDTSGVKGISLRNGDQLVGMVVADPEATLLTACEYGYGKRTKFGPSTAVGTAEGEEGAELEAEEPAELDEVAATALEETAEGEEAGDETSSGARYRTQRRGGKGLHDIKTTDRNGRVIGIVRVDDDDELLMMTARGKIQRIRARDISVIGRNTKGVRIMTLDEGDTLAAVVRVPKEEGEGPTDETEILESESEAEGAPFDDEAESNLTEGPETEEQE
jgi:DNA gyrase subunit A